MVVNIEKEETETVRWFSLERSVYLFKAANKMGTIHVGGDSLNNAAAPGCFATGVEEISRKIKMKTFHELNHG